MKLATIQTPEGPRAAAVVGDSYVDLAASDPELPGNIRGLLEAGPDALRSAERAIHRHHAVGYEAENVTLLPPVPDPHKIVCIGVNYRDHAAETGKEIPKEPVLFSKYATALIGHEASIVLPAVSQEV